MTEKTAECFPASLYTAASPVWAVAILRQALSPALTVWAQYFFLLFTILDLMCLPAFWRWEMNSADLDYEEKVCKLHKKDTIFFYISKTVLNSPH